MKKLDLLFRELGKLKKLKRRGKKEAQELKEKMNKEYSSWSTSRQNLSLSAKSRLEYESHNIDQYVFVPVCNWLRGRVRTEGIYSGPIQYFYKFTHYLENWSRFTDPLTREIDHRGYVDWTNDQDRQTDKRIRKLCCQIRKLMSTDEIEDLCSVIRKYMQML